MMAVIADRSVRTDMYPASGIIPHKAVGRLHDIAVEIIHYIVEILSIIT